MKLTPRFDKETKPVRPGLYRLSMNGGGGTRWSWWDGSNWNGAWTTKAAAINHEAWSINVGGQGLCDIVSFSWVGLSTPTGE